MWKKLLKDPGLDKTLIGDGVATAVSALGAQQIQHMVKILVSSV